MNLKNKGFYESSVPVFSLLGNDENALSYSFAYFISKDINAYFLFIRNLGLNYKRSQNHYKNVLIEIQKRRKEGITDIEIKYENEYHIIIECKINKNKTKEQRDQYLSAFSDAGHKLLVFLTQDAENFRIPASKIIIHRLTWLDVFGLFNEHNISNKKVYDEFNKFVERGYGMASLIREILVQDVGDKEQIVNFKENNLYRRPESAGRPIYFAPYFTRERGETEGITYISKVLGVLTINPLKIDEMEDELKIFAQDDQGNVNQKLLKKWKEGVKKERNKEPFTYYFLDEPFQFKTPVLKNKVTESKGWIGGSIPRNRTITFKSLLEHM